MQVRRVWRPKASLRALKEAQRLGTAPSTRANSHPKEIKVWPNRVSSSVKCISSASSPKSQAATLVCQQELLLPMANCNAKKIIKSLNLV
jgi:hypothetical protein